MAKTKGARVSHKNQYAAYKAENRYIKNRVKKLIKYVTNNPNDKVAEKALDKFEKGNMSYRRKKPQGHGFPPQKKVKIIKEAYGYLPNANIKSAIMNSIR